MYAQSISSLRQTQLVSKVFTVFIADTVSTVFLLDYAYDSLVVHFGAQM